MSIVEKIRPFVAHTMKSLYSTDFDEKLVTISPTKPEFAGDYRVVLFTFVKLLKKSPEQIGQEAGEALLKSHPELFRNFNVIKGFLNLEIHDEFWTRFLSESYSNKRFGLKDPTEKVVMVEYSSPNT